MNEQLAALVALVEAALAELGDTPDEVARTLRGAGIRGHKSECGTCPVALWLAHRVPELRGPGGMFLWDVNRVGIADARGDWVAWMPDPVCRFISLFDHEDEYEDLVAAGVAS